MMKSPPIDDSYDPCHPRWRAAGRDQTCIRPPDWPASASQIPSGNVPTERSPRSARPGFAASRPRQPLLPNPFRPSPAAKSP